MSSTNIYKCNDNTSNICKFFSYYCFQIERLSQRKCCYLPGSCENGVVFIDHVRKC